MSSKQEIYLSLKKSYLSGGGEVSVNEDHLLKLTALFLFQLSSKDKQGLIDLLHPDVSFQQPPLPLYRGKGTVVKLLGKIFSILSIWQLKETLSVALNGNTVVIERVEVFGLLGLKLVLPGTMVVVFKGDKIVRISDYIDLLTCIAQTFIAPFRMIKDRYSRIF